MRYLLLPAALLLAAAPAEKPSKQFLNPGSGGHRHRAGVKNLSPPRHQDTKKSKRNLMQFLVSLCLGGELVLQPTP